jgi:hypothetical protein
MKHQQDHPIQKKWVGVTTHRHTVPTDKRHVGSTVALRHSQKEVHTESQKRNAGGVMQLLFISWKPRETTLNISESTSDSAASSPKFTSGASGTPFIASRNRSSRALRQGSGISVQRQPNNEHYCMRTWPHTHGHTHTRPHTACVISPTAVTPGSSRTYSFF